jgi:hypothetical protein
MIAFIDHLHVAGTSNCSAIANLHSLQITRADTATFRFVFTSRFLVTDPNKVLRLHPYWLANIPQLNHSKSESKLLYDWRLTAS